MKDSTHTVLGVREVGCGGHGRGVFGKIDHKEAIAG